MVRKYKLNCFFGKDGFVSHWLICGPFPNETKANPNPVLFEKKLSKYWDKDWLKNKETSEMNIKPKAGLCVKGPGDFLRKWIIVHVKYIHWIEAFRFYSLFPETAAYLEKNCKSKCWDEWDAITYLATYIEMQKGQEVILNVGAWDGFKLWVNGKFIDEEHTYHHSLVDQKKYVVHFNKGLNLLLIKMDRRKAALRITGPNDMSLTGAKIVLPGENAKLSVTLGAAPLSPIDSFRKIAYEIKPKMSCSLDRKDKILNWQEKFREKLISLTLPDGLPEGKLNIRLIEKVDEGSYIREKILYWREKSLTKVPAYVLIPKKPNTRAMVCLHGHNGGKECGKRGPASVPLNEYQAKIIRENNYDYAKQFALRGYVTITPDAIGFGERFEGSRFYNSSDACNLLNLSANFIGTHLFGFDIYDYIGAVDYLINRKEVNHKKIGCIGLSFGGTSTYLLSAIDKRISVVIISCAVTSFKEYLQKFSGCGSQTINGILKYGDISDICALIAPRPLLIESGRYDSCFSILFAEDAYNKLKKVYTVLGVPDKIDADFFEGGHRFSGAKAFEWVNRAV